MTDLSRIVSVVTSISQSAVNQAGFGTVLVYGPAAPIAPDYVREYRTLAALLDDGFVATDPVYRAAQAIFSQSPTVEAVKVGRAKTGLQARVLTLTPTAQDGGNYAMSINGVDIVAQPARTVTPTAVNSTLYSVTIDGVVYSITSDSSATATEIVSSGATNLIAEINVGTATHGVTASGTATLILTPAPGFTPTITVGANLAIAANTTTEVVTAVKAAIQASTQGAVFVETGTATLILTGATAGDVPLVTYDSKFTMQDTTPAQTSTGFATDLADIQGEDDDFYGIVFTGTSKAEILDYASGISATKKQGFYVTGDQDVISTAYATGDDGTDDVGTRILNLGRGRMHGFWAQDVFSYPNGAAAAAGLRDNPGETTFALKDLAGVAAPTLTETQVSRLLAKNMNFMMSTNGRKFTSNNGINGDGLFTDSRVFIDFADARISESLLSLMLSAKKIPYTNIGFSALKNSVRAFLLSQALEGGAILKESIVVTIPDANDAAPADRAARLVRGLTYAYVTTGAVHSVRVTGAVVP